MAFSDQNSFESFHHISTVYEAVQAIKLKESETASDQDVEDKFSKLSLAFKTDKFTLTKRLELQNRQRETAEKNIDIELESLRESLNVLNQLCTESHMREIITKTQQHIDIIQQSTSRMSSHSEVFGAIQQEKRMSHTFETIMAYVEHLRQLHDKEHQELEEYRRLLRENRLIPDENYDGTDESKRQIPSRSMSMSGTSKPISRRRASVAACIRPCNLEGHKTAGNSGLCITCLTNENYGVEPRARLLSAVCLLTNQSGTSSSSSSNMPSVYCSSSSSAVLPVRGRRSSLPVGSTGGLIRAPQLIANPLTQTSNVNLRSHGNISEQPEQTKGDTIQEPASESQQDPCNSEENPKSVIECKDDTFELPNDISQSEINSDICQSNDDIDEQENQIISDNVMMSALEKQMPWDDQEPLDSDISQIKATTAIDIFIYIRHYLLIFHTWLQEQDLWHWDSATMVRMFRYFLSVLLLIGAACSLVITFLPSQATAARVTSSSSSCFRTSR